MQPLDRAVMRPFKAAYNQACSVWMRKYHLMKISQRNVADLVNTAYFAICRMDLAQSAFDCTGLLPCNPDVSTDLDFIPAEHFKELEPIAKGSAHTNEKRVAEEKKQAAVKRKLEKDTKKDEMCSKGRKSGASQLSKIADKGDTTNKKRQNKLNCGENKKTIEHNTTCIICLESFEEEFKNPEILENIDWPLSSTFAIILGKSFLFVGGSIQVFNYRGQIACVLFFYTLTSKRVKVAGTAVLSPTLCKCPDC
ncbi:hypothetical protein ILUMI_19692 [Ignelater luminosus]|uniref:Uncharacterized protein n=1 Tax=Ignelater luminosus TaxID=2038154 RepID=A0A8K0CJZ8_IGNLU|nr:hypothetical protein ILUMI_19692 [Ignelater luminosus]